MIRRNLNRRARSSRAIYNRVMESIAPKVKRAVLNEYGSSLFFEYTCPISLTIKENAPTIFGNLDADYITKMKIWLGTGVASEIMQNYDTRFGPSLHGCDHYVVNGTKTFKFNAGIKIIEPTGDFFTIFAYDGDTYSNPAGTLIEVYNLDNISDKTVYPILFFEDGDTYMHASDASGDDDEYDGSESGWIQVYLNFKDSSVKHAILSRIKSIIGKLRTEYERIHFK